LNSSATGDNLSAIGNSLARQIGNALKAVRPMASRRGYVRAQLDAADLYANPTQRQSCRGKSLAAFACRHNYCAQNKPITNSLSCAAAMLQQSVANFFLANHLLRGGKHVQKSCRRQ
jgi:hypothetical protein